MKSVQDKIERMRAGECVVMTDREMDYLDQLDCGLDYVSMANELRLGTRDRWIVMTTATRDARTER